MTTHLDDLGLRAVEGEGGGGDAKLAEVDAGEPRVGGAAGGGEVVDDEAVDEEGLPDDLDLRVQLLVEVLAEEQHVAEQEGVHVHLPGKKRFRRRRRKHW